MSIKANAPILIRSAGATVGGFVRRVSSNFDLLVETSGQLRVGDTGAFDLDLGDLRVEGRHRVRNAGERSGPYTRYILRIVEMSDRHRERLLEWARVAQQTDTTRKTSEVVHHIDTAEFRFRQPEPVATGEVSGLRSLPSTGRRTFPEAAVEVDLPIAMRTDRGMRIGSVRRFQGTQFEVTIEGVLPVGRDAYFQLEIPDYNMPIFGTAAVRSELEAGGAESRFLLSLHMLRHADQDLLVEWLHDQCAIPCGEVEAPGGSTTTDTEPGPYQRMAGRKAIREVLRARLAQVLTPEGRRTGGLRVGKPGPGQLD